MDDPQCHSGGAQGGRKGWAMRTGAQRPPGFRGIPGGLRDRLHIGRAGQLLRREAACSKGRNPQAVTVAALSSPVDLSQRRHAPLVRILPALSPFLLARWGQRWTMELLEAINGRRSVREYTDRAVDDAVLRELIDAAVQAPSA